MLHWWYPCSPNTLRAASRIRCCVRCPRAPTRGLSENGARRTAAGGSPWELVARGAIDQTDTTVRTMSPAIEPFRVAVDDAVARRPPPPPRARAPSRSDRRHRMGVRDPDRLPANVGGVLARRVRLARAGSAAQQARQLPHARSTASRSTSSTPARRTPDAFPLLLLHGWPGSIVEFLEVDPAASPGPRPTAAHVRDAFHVVAPSLPGYGFSEPTRTRGWDVPRIARAFIELMRRLELRALRRAGRRLGCPGRDEDRRARSRALRRDPPQHADRRPSGGRSHAHRRRQSRPGGHATVRA